MNIPHSSNLPINFIRTLIRAIYRELSHFSNQVGIYELICQYLTFTLSFPPNITGAISSRDIFLLIYMQVLHIKSYQGVILFVSFNTLI